MSRVTGELTSIMGSSPNMTASGLLTFWSRRNAYQPRGRCQARFLGLCTARQTPLAGRVGALLIVIAVASFNTRNASEHLRLTARKAGDFLLQDVVTQGACLATRQYAPLVSAWISSIGLHPLKFGTHSLRRTKATLTYRRTGNLRLHERPDRVFSQARVGLQCHDITTHPSAPRAPARLVRGEDWPVLRASNRMSPVSVDKAASIDQFLQRRV